MPRALITTVPFAESIRRPIDLLEEAGISYVINPLGRRLQAEELPELLEGVDLLIAGTEPITASALRSAKNLKLIARVGIGLDNVDLDTARELGIAVSYTPDGPTPAVAELTIGLMLDLLRNISGSDRMLRAGSWHRFMGRRLSHCTVGVIGVGRIGRSVIRHLSLGFPGVRILANDIDPSVKTFAHEHNFEVREKDDIFREADIITLHVPLTAETHRLISARELAMMKRDALIVNTARGGIVDEEDLAKALNTKRIAGAAVDVFVQEPYSGALREEPNCILTCHMGSMSKDCRSRMEIEATEECVRFIRGEPLASPAPAHAYKPGHLRRGEGQH